MRNIQRGFVGALVLLVTAVLVLGGAYYSSKTRKTIGGQSSATTTVQMQTYTGPLFSIRYPKNWQILSPSTCDYKELRDGNCIEIAPVALVRERGTQMGEGTLLIAATSSDWSPQDWLTKADVYWVRNFIGPEGPPYDEVRPLTIHGYPALLTRYSSMGGYQDYTYVISHKGVLVGFAIRSYATWYKDGANMPPVVYDYSSYLPDVESIVNSIKLAN